MYSAWIKPRSLSKTFPKQFHQILFSIDIFDISIHQLLNLKIINIIFISNVTKSVTLNEKVINIFSLVTGHAFFCISLFAYFIM